MSWLSGLFQEFLENQESPDTPGFSRLFPGFSTFAKKLGKPNILPQNSGLLFAGAWSIFKKTAILYSLQKNNSLHGTLFLPLVKEQRFKLGLFNDGKGVINNRQKLLKRNYCHFNSKMVCCEAT